jgi:molecular chaperone DnaK (HSP70)
MHIINTTLHHTTLLYSTLLWPAIGVDLGTTFSVVGVKSGGEVSIVQDSSGRVLVPSVVAFLDNGEGGCALWLWLF